MRLIITTDSSTAAAIQRAGLADLVIAIERRLVWGPLPSDTELGAFFAPRTTQPHRLHWLDDTPPWRLEKSAVKDRGLIELVSECGSSELWIGPEPNAQLTLLWLFDHCGGDRAAVSKLVLRQLESARGGLDSERVAQPSPHAVALTPDHLVLAGRAWRAYLAPTPQDWFDLLKADLSLLPQLERCAVDILEELPGVSTGLGATEIRILELISPGEVPPFEVFPGHRKLNERRVFGYWEVGTLLDGLARCERPAVSGLDEGRFSPEMHDASTRFARYKASRLSLTEFGKAVLGGDEDFRCSNPIDRWWGGTHLTNDRLWRYGPVLTKPA